MKLLSAMLMMFVVFLGPAGAAAAPSTIAVLHGPTTVEAYGGVQAWSDYDPTSHTWNVVVRRNGQISMPTILTAQKAIEVDVGPGPSGVPMLAYTSCTNTCDVVVSDVNGSDPQTVSGSEGASHPTIWGEHVAWVSGKGRVMISRLNGSERRVLAGAPKRKCYYVGDETETTKPRLVCKAPEDPIVEALQLYRGHLVLIDTFIIQDGIGSVGTTTEVRTEAVTGGPQRLIAVRSVGEGDESYISPSWANGKLYFYEDSVGAGFEVYRYNPARNTYAMAPAHTYLTGFSVVGNRAYEATASNDPGLAGTCQPEEDEPCVLQLSEPFKFKLRKTLIHIP